MVTTKGELVAIDFGCIKVVPDAFYIFQEVVVINLIGEKIKHYQLDNLEKTAFDVSHLSNGLYFLKIKTSQGEVRHVVLVIGTLIK